MKKLRTDPTRRPTLKLRAETVAALATHQLEQVIGGRTGISGCFLCRTPD